MEIIPGFGNLIKSEIVGITSVSLYEGQLILVKPQTDVEIDSEYAQKLVDLLLKFADGKPFYLLSDTTGVYYRLTKEAQNILQGNKRFQELKLASATVIDNLSNRIMMNLYLNILGRRKNVKLFGTFSSALTWLDKISNPTNVSV